jgi:hypothetical protein
LALRFAQVCLDRFSTSGGLVTIPEYPQQNVFWARGRLIVEFTFLSAETDRVEKIVLGEAWSFPPSDGSNYPRRWAKVQSANRSLSIHTD